VLGTQENSIDRMIFTTFFFADVDFFCEKFIIPINAVDWYDINLIKKYHLHKSYEHIFYKLFEEYLNLFYNSADEFDNSLLELNPNNRKNLAWGIHDRRNCEKNLLKTYFTIVPCANGNKNLVLSNQTHHLQSGIKSYSIKINFDGEYKTNVLLAPHMYYILEVPNETKFVNLEIDDYGVLDLNNSTEKVNHNGIFMYLN
jgi:hypothetical protein